ncbi:MAG: PIN domain-containing protein [Chthoniobacterales bacterium]
MKEKTASWLDSSAILALLDGEPGVETVRELLEDAERGRASVYFSAVTLTEIVSSLTKTHGESAARDELQVVLTLPCEIAVPTRAQFIEAGWLRGLHRLSTADAVIAVQAIAANAALVHKDPEFEAISDLRQTPLPYKKPGTRSR